MKIAICDDLQSARQELHAMVREYLAQESMTAEILEFSSGEALLEVFSPGLFDLIFLDIYMDGITGIQTAHLIREKDPDCLIVFTTTSLEHGADAFDLEAFHYLVKPVDKTKLFSMLTRWKNLLSEIQTIPLRCGRSVRPVLIRDILYIEVQGRSSTVYTAKEAIPTSMTLSSLEEALPAGQFVKPIRYQLAALRHIRTVGEQELELENGTKLKMSRGERENLRQQLSSYRLRMLRRR